MTARLLPAGIARDGKGFRVFVSVRLGHKIHQLKSKRFPSTATVGEMKAWRERQRVEARGRATPMPARGTLARDIETYLDQVAAMKTITWRKRDLEAWREAFGDLDRRRLTSGMIRAQLHAWRTEGPTFVYLPRTGERRIVRDRDGRPRPLSASACNHRRTALLHLFSVLDGKGAPNPVREVPTFREPPPAPRGRDLAQLAAAIKTLRNPKQRARAAVLLWTGIRGNSELAAMSPAHLDLDAAVCFVPSGKGGTKLRTVPLNAAGVEAWREFVKVDAWGQYDKNALRKSLGRACERLGLADVRTYDLRHSLATAYLKIGADLADVQDLLGHTTARMTRRYAPFHPARLRELGARLLPASLTGSPQPTEKKEPAG